MKKNRGELIPGAEAMFGIEAEHVDAEIVGWAVVVGFSAKGVGHLCIECRPAQPVGMSPVFAPQIAAMERCQACGQRLDEIRRGAER